MARVEDEELRRAFGELHDKVTDTRQKLKLSDIQIESLKRTKQRAELTQIELRSLPEKTRTFESVGRMFMLQNIDTIKSDLSKRTKGAEEKIKSLETTKVYLQQSLKESENNIREMVQRRLNQNS